MKFDILTINTSIKIFGIIICMIVILCRRFVVGGNRGKIRTDFTLLVLCEALVLFFGAVSGILTGSGTKLAHSCLVFCSFTENLFNLMLLGFFTNYVLHSFPSKKELSVHIIAWGIITAGAVLLIINFIRPMFWYINGANVLQRTKLYVISQLPAMLIFSENLIFIIINRKKVSRLVFISFIFYMIIPLLALTVQNFIIGLDVVSCAIIIVLMIMFVIMQNQLVNDYIEQKRQLQESSVKLMISQIKPHFIFNSLTAIAQLCDDDPALAKKTTVSFAKYLRGNLTALEKTEAVPFEDELNHIKNYLNIECVRFGDDLRIVYDIETTDFRVPVLSIQPLIENAVKHGVGMKENGGTVTLSVKRNYDSILLKVSDDGVGFDTAAPLPDSGHIGILSSTKRLKMLCGAETEIESEIGKGTVITVTLPQTK